MRLFISWSGSKSGDVAAALRDWLPGVMNSVEPFVSSEDIYAGARWQSDIASTLDISNFGIVCVTRENQGSPWLNFEAGALAKAVDVSRVIPLAVDLKPSDVELPLGQFQAQPATEDGLRAVVVSINDALGETRLSDELLRESFAVWWPTLEAKLHRIEEQTTTASPPARTDRELLEETLDTVRFLARTADQIEGSSIPSDDWWLTKHLRGRTLDSLPNRERELLVLRFGLAGEAPMTLDAIARHFGITRERVRQIEGNALRKIALLADAADDAE
jgi:RNA polymerase sigma factor (sigma-70 family)